MGGGRGGRTHRPLRLRPSRTVLLPPMAQTLLEQLSQMTVVVADTGDINAIRKFKPRDATTNPSLIMAAAQMKEYAQVVDDALGWARKDAGAGADQGRRRPQGDRPPERRVRPAHPRDRRRAASRPRSTRASPSTRRRPSRRRTRSSGSTRRRARRASASSSRSPRRGRASRRPRCSRRRASTATSRSSSACTRPSRAPRRA